MKQVLVLAAILALTACAGSPRFGSNGPRTDWRCDGGAAFSVRAARRGAVELFAGGRIYTLPRAGAGFSDGDVTYTPQNDSATLTGAFGGPYANCRRG